jgi:hypothetical protein
MSLPGFPHRVLRQRGHAAVEFALIAVILFSFVFGTIETARIVYVWSTMTQVISQTARGAALTSPKDTDEWDAMRLRAMFLSEAGQTLPLAGDIGIGHLRIDYLKFDATTTVAAPLCRAQNTVNCLNAPTGDSCVRFVRVRLCQPGDGACASVSYQPLVNFPGLNVLKVAMPHFTAIAPLETMGKPGDCSSPNPAHEDP